MFLIILQKQMDKIWLHFIHCVFSVAFRYQFYFSTKNLFLFFILDFYLSLKGRLFSLFLQQLGCYRDCDEFQLSISQIQYFPFWKIDLLKYISSLFLLWQSSLMTKHIKSKVQVLNRGEKSKVRLDKIMNWKTNFLVLDEPTNHLDVDIKVEWTRAYYRSIGAQH